MRYDTSKRDSHITLWLPEEMKEEIRDVAKYCDTTMTDWIVAILYLALTERKHQIDGIRTFYDYTRFGIEKQAGKLESPKRELSNVSAK